MNKLEIKGKDDKSKVIDNTSIASFGDKLFSSKSGTQQQDNVFQGDDYQSLATLDLSNTIDSESNEKEQNATNAQAQSSQGVKSYSRSLALD